MWRPAFIWLILLVSAGALAEPPSSAIAFVVGVQHYTREADLKVLLR